MGVYEVEVGSRFGAVLAYVLIPIVALGSGIMFYTMVVYDPRVYGWLSYAEELGRVESDYKEVWSNPNKRIPVMLLSGAVTAVFAFYWIRAVWRKLHGRPGFNPE